MSDLRQIQQAFQRYVMEDDETVAGFVDQSSGALAQHRLATYYNAYRIRLIDALAVNYPVLRGFLGETAFENLALGYLSRHPSRHASIRWFGDQLPAYLPAAAELTNIDLLREIASFDWARTTVFDATNCSSLVTLETMARLPVEQWPQLQFQFKPAIRWLDLSYNVPQLAAAIDRETGLPEPLAAEPQRWLVWRKDHNLYWRSLEVDEAWALEAAMRGSSFSTVCDGLLEWLDSEQVAISAATMVKQWITDQLITKLTQKE